MAQVQNIVTAERFAQGFTYESYIAQIKANKDQFDKNYKEFELAAADKDFFTKLRAKKLKVLALGEDWCPDVYRGLPVMAKVAQVGGIELRVLPRDQHLDIMDQYLNQGKFRSIPTFVFFTGDMKYLGHWIERPASANHFITSVRTELSRLGKSEAEQRAEMARRRETVWGDWRQETVRELRELIAKFA